MLLLVRLRSYSGSMQPLLLVRHHHLAPRISVKLLRRHFLQKLKLARLAALRALNANAGKHANLFDGGSRGRQLAGFFALARSWPKRTNE